MILKIFYFFALVIVLLGMIMYVTDRTANISLNRVSDSAVLTFNGTQVIFLGVVALIGGFYAQKKRNTDNT